MSTGEDLSEDANPRLRGRKPKNEDILEQGVWIQHPETGVVHLITHKYQRNRLLLEGGKVVEPPALEEAHASQSIDVAADKPREALDRGPESTTERSGHAVSGPGHSRHAR